jgi:hypothetical protein
VDEGGATAAGVLLETDRCTAGDIVVFGALRDAFSHGWLPDGSFTAAGVQRRLLHRQPPRVIVVDRPRGRRSRRPRRRGGGRWRPPARACGFSRTTAPMGGEVPEPWRLNRALSSGCSSVPEEALHLVFGYLDDQRDREAASFACRRWHRIDVLTLRPGSPSSPCSPCTTHPYTRRGISPEQERERKTKRRKKEEATAGSIGRGENERRKER